MPPKNYTIIQKHDGIPSADAIDSILSTAINSVDPGRLVRQQIVLSNGTLCIGKNIHPDQKSTFLLALGKASIAMTQAAVDILGDRIKTGICVCKSLPTKPPEWKTIELLQGAHPVPDERSLNAGKRIREFLHGMRKGDLVLVLISGGASALVTSPREGITLNDLQELNRALLHSGATIDEMNCLRKHMEILKGGGLLQLAQPAKLETLILSDVIGNDMSVIASGPTVADPTTFGDAMKIIADYHLGELIPESILRYLERGMQGSEPETLKPDNEINRKVTNTIIGSNRHAVDAAIEEAKNHGIQCECLSDHLTGEANDAAHWFIEQSVVASKRYKNPFMTIAGGETTVTIHGDGKGGRNLQVALAGVNRMAELENAILITLATDGEDGPTDAAGAIVTADTKKRAQALGLDPDNYLTRNDAYIFFEKTGGLIKTGSTGTNVNDLTFFFQF